MRSELVPSCCSKKATLGLSEFYGQRPFPFTSRPTQPTWRWAVQHSAKKAEAGDEQDRCLFIALSSLSPGKSRRGSSFVLTELYQFLSSAILSLHLGDLSGNQKIPQEPTAFLEILLRPKRLSSLIWDGMICLGLWTTQQNFSSVQAQI